MIQDNCYEDGAEFYSQQEVALFWKKKSLALEEELKNARALATTWQNMSSMQTRVLYANAHKKDPVKQEFLSLKEENQKLRKEVSDLRYEFKHTRSELKDVCNQLEDTKEELAAIEYLKISLKHRNRTIRLLASDLGKIKKNVLTLKKQFTYSQIVQLNLKLNKNDCENKKVNLVKKRPKQAIRRKGGRRGGGEEGEG